ncbi:hypothetical protein [Candidatus Palauibacter irciniicola]|uniref:hypothetical protein n=1 Tax=Candidatus Palauibacter irciniicola TaxID=3056733 RepID=UPI003B01C125
MAARIAIAATHSSGLRLCTAPSVSRLKGTAAARSVITRATTHIATTFHRGARGDFRRMRASGDARRRKIATSSQMA